MSLTIRWLQHSRMWIPSLWHDNSEQAVVWSSPPARGPSAGAIKQPGLHLLLAVSPHPRHLSYRPTPGSSPLPRFHYDTLTEWLQIGQVFRRCDELERDRLTGREEVAKSAIMLYFQGAKKSHHWLNHLYKIRWFQQFHLMRKSPLLL